MRHDNAHGSGGNASRPQTAEQAMAISAATNGHTEATSGRRAWLRPVVSWPCIVAAVALARPLSAGLAVLNDPDTYLHVAARQWMIAHAALPVRDPFSHPMAGPPWVPHEWLSEVVLAGVDRLARWTGLVLLTALCFAVALALLTRAPLRRWEPFSA